MKILLLKLLKLIYYIKLKIMNEFMIALEDFQDAHVLYTGEHITKNQIKNMYDCQLDANSLKKLKKQLIMIHSISLLNDFGEFNSNDL